MNAFPDKTPKPTLKGSVTSFASTGIKLNKKAVSDPTVSSSVEEWQTLAFDHFDCIPEIGFGLQKIADILSRGELRIMERSSGGKRGSVKRVPTVNKTALTVLDNFRPRIGTSNILMYQLALNLLIAGEVYLCKGEDNIWFVASVLELRSKVLGSKGGAVYYQIKNRDGTVKDLSEKTYVKRIWRPHPKFQEFPDGAMKRNVLLCQEVLTLTRLIDVIAKSRLHAPWIVMPDEVSFGPDDEVEDETSENVDKLDPFDRELLEGVIASIEDPSDPVSISPKVLRMPKEFMISQSNIIHLGRDMETVFVDLRDDAMLRILKGLDLPVELVGGKTDTNGWSAYSIDQDLISKHVVTLADLICGFLTSCWLVPELVRLGVKNVENFYVELDVSNIAAKPDLTSSAKDLFDRFLLDGESVRRLSGFEESDAPSEESARLQLMYKLVQQSPELAAAILPLIPGFEDVDVSLIQSNEYDPTVKKDGVSVDSNSKSGPPVGRNAEGRKRKGQDAPTKRGE
jgi:hypothetical protein